MVKLFESYYERHYRTSCCSCVTLTSCILYVFAIVAPLVFVYNTNGKFLNHSNLCIGAYVEKQMYYEQPTIFFTNELLLEVLDDDGTSHHYSTKKEVFDMANNPLSQPLIKFSEFDSNSDGKKDAFWLRLNFKMDPTKVRKVNLYAVFDYYLQDRIKIKMKGLVHFSIDTPLGASFIKSNGQIELKQRKPILIDSKTRELYFEDPLDGVSSQFSNEQILDKYNDRLGKCLFKLTSVETLQYVGNTLVQPLGSSFSSNIEIKMNVPTSQPVMYRPGIMETVKFLWVQYVYILIPVVVLLNVVLGLLFKYKVLDSHMVSDLKPARKIM